MGRTHRMKPLPWWPIGLPAIALWGGVAVPAATATPLRFDLATAPDSAVAIARSPQDPTVAARPPHLPPAPAPHLAFVPPRVWFPQAIAARSTPPAAAVPAPYPSQPQPPHQPVAPSPVAPSAAPAGAALPLPHAPLPPVPPTAVLPPPPMASTALPAEVEALFTGGSDSILARAVGHAEGTRTVTGARTAAYWGHRDPGNGAWNLGSFSSQHGAPTPTQADAQQLHRLRTHAQGLHQQATAADLSLGQAVWLNGLDLANQSPAAALDRGYLHWFTQAQHLQMPEAEAILWARTRSFLDPDTGRWNAPGLGNTVQSISADQARRQAAIAQVLALLNSPFSGDSHGEQSD